MAQIPFVGPSYNLDSRPSGVQRTINLIPVPEEPGNERTSWVFKDVPGLTAFNQGTNDPFFANVMALWHFNGDFVDSSSFNRVGTLNDATIAASPSLYGSGSMRIPQGPFTAATAATVFALSPVSGAYTIEFAFVGPTSSVGVVLRASASNEFIFGWSWFGGNTARMTVSTKNGAGVNLNSALLTVAGDGIFHQYALVRQPTTGLTSLYVDGVLSVSGTDTQAMNVTATIGFSGGVASPVVSYLDEVRITAAVARYSGSSYVLPSGEFPNR